MVIFDANFLLLLVDPDADVPTDPGTGLPLTRVRERVEFLIAGLSQRKETIGIPTPVVSEVLVHAGEAGPKWLGVIGDSGRFRVLPFDLRAAVETAAMTASAKLGGDKRAGSSAPWQKVKVDRQIVAIGAVGRASTIYADDNGVVRLAKAAGIEAVSSWNLPPPPEDPQGELGV